MPKTTPPLKATMEKASPLRLARLQRGLDPDLVARSCGLGKSNLLRIERGKVTPRPAVARILFELYAGDVAWPDVFGVPSLEQARLEVGSA